MPRTALTALALSTLVLAAGCIGESGGVYGNEPIEAALEGPSLDGAPRSIELTSPAFEAGGTIPRKYTCDGQDISPPLNWEGVPEGTKSLVLTVIDPQELPESIVHWIVFNLPPTATSLPEGAGSGLATLPDGARQGINSFFNSRYDGPCPFEGTPHGYVFNLYALDTDLYFDERARALDIRGAIVGHILAEGRLVASFGRGEVVAEHGE